MTAISSERVKHAMQLCVNHVVNSVSEQLFTTQAEAYRRFVQSKTYALLCAEESKLYTESFEYVLDMYNSELCGDIENWLAQ